MGFGVFSSILTSCIEVFPKETIGLLGGYPTQRRNILVMANPVQLAKRGRHSVEILNRKNQERTMKIFKSLGIEFYGFYHSHSDGLAQPSQGDLISTLEEILWMKKRKCLLEIIIQIRRRKYQRKQRHDFKIQQHLSTGSSFEGYLIAPNNRYDFKFVAEWVEVAPIKYALVPNRYQANLMMIKSEI
jgi:proteasome lid subunit RPN8/RPN11